MFQVQRWAGPGGGLTGGTSAPRDETATALVPGDGDASRGVRQAGGGGGQRLDGETRRRKREEEARGSLPSERGGSHASRARKPAGKKGRGAGKRPGGGGDVDEEEEEEEEAPREARKAPKTRGAPVLPWMRVPITIEAGEGVPLGNVGGLDERVAAALGNSGIIELFPVQAAVWLHLAGGASAAHDLCVCAPTGSGKTLSYVLPVVQALSTRVVTRLRALVVLPTLDLALQVHAVFQTVCPAVGLACGLCGQAAMAVEQRALAAGVDVLVCTPGRLMAHVARTPGFTLEHLRFLVVDETDRLLRQSYQDWLPHVVAACADPGGGKDAAEGAESGGWLGAGGARAVRLRHRERGASEPCPRAIKIVLSATLTRDPAKISRLDLHCPRYIATSASDHRYKLPQQLEEYKLVCPEHMKPLVLLALLQHLPREPTILFASSVDATHRLHLLLSCVEGLPFRTAEYSSRQSPADRSRALEGFRSGKVGVLVASDAATRGIDIEGVGTVVNYDAPVYAKTYVHRVGRTARAGKGGRCFTLLRREDARHFRDMLRKADHNQVRDHQLPEGALEAWRPVYTDALARLQAAVEAEAAAAAAPSSRGAAAALPQVVRGQAARAFRLQAAAPA